ncbi:MAG TPA: tRNA lysidine(34) synthetase TilS [Spongiibacteraceae bacterium]|nr:tRNA lysidine(34) synthetase TilS [Spongiibacteraceae bacterium]
MNPADLSVILEPYLSSRRWYIAYSGGVDSHVLLHAVASLRDKLRESITERQLPPLTAIHINHQINPQATAWVVHCQTVCADLGIELIVETVAVERDAGQGLEAAARLARYAAFERHLGSDELLLQAHHRDDQIETLLLRLLRGSGLAGLASMPAARPLGNGRLLRPLLAVTRAAIIGYAQHHQLRWIHDDSNDNEGFDRNFLRLRVLPLAAERWPSYRDTLQRVIDNAAEADGLLKELAALDYAGAIAPDRALQIDNCQLLSAARQRNLIFYWLQQQQLPPPSREQLVQVLKVFDACDDAEPCVSWPGAELRRFRGHLYAMPPLPELPAAIDIEWQPPQPLSIAGLGELQCSPVIGAGLRTDRHYRVRNRRGGERCRPLGRAHSQTLKKLLQEYGVKPWLRDRLPLIYCGDEIAAVASLWICEGYQATPGENGWHIEWRF